MKRDPSKFALGGDLDSFASHVLGSERVNSIAAWSRSDDDPMRESRTVDFHLLFGADGAEKWRLGADFARVDAVRIEIGATEVHVSHVG